MKLANKMGCLVPKDSEDPEPATISMAALPPEERALMAQEKRLPFSALSSREIVRSLKCETDRDTMSLPQFKRSLTELKIPVETAISPDSVFYKLIKRLRNDKKLYDLKLLSVLAILIGKGDSKEKAEWLFKQYDVDAQGMLDSTELSNMVKDLIFVSCEALPVIVKGQGPGFLSQEELDNYLRPLVSNKEAATLQIVKTLLGEAEISLNEFQMRVGDSRLDCAQLVWSFGVRKLTRNYV